MIVLKKEEIFKEFGKNKKDSGSSESQIALFTKRIENLSSHLKNNAKDFNTERSLVKMVGKRKDGSIISRTARIKDKRIQILSVDLINKKCRIVPKRSAQWS